MQLGELLKAAGYPASEAYVTLEVGGICADSRRVRQGDVFVALSGLHYDGHCYIAEALARGALFVVSERFLMGVPLLVVESTREALSRLFDAWYGHPTKDICLIGITGPNGKTSTAAMLAALIFLLMFFNYFYLKFAVRKIKNIKSEYASCGKQEIMKHIAEAGRPSLFSGLALG